ncbi:MAG: methyltransferase family protein [Candidatus Thorarchaeota archaeon]
MIELLFSIVLFADTLLLLGVGISIGLQKYRIWPPPGKRSWQYWTACISITVASLGVPLVGILDWETLGPVHWLRYPAGEVLIVGSIALVIWGMRTLSLHQSLGLEGVFVTEGPYQYSRNPQYLALILFYSAFILITSSFLALVTGFLLILAYALTPFSKEPWLEEQFGDAYIEYKMRVSRFVGFKR